MFAPQKLWQTLKNFDYPNIHLLHCIFKTYTLCNRLTTSTCVASLKLRLFANVELSLLRLLTTNRPCINVYHIRHLVKYYPKRYLPLPCPVTGVIKLLSFINLIKLDAADDFKPVICSTFVLPKQPSLPYCEKILIA